MAIERKVSCVVPETATLSYDRIDVRDLNGKFRLRIHGVSATALVSVGVTDADGTAHAGFIHVEDLGRMLFEQLAKQREGGGVG